LKRGKNGSTYFDRERQIDVSPLAADEVDPTGAGDCFGGTFISCLAQGIPLQRALALANAAGSLAVRMHGPMEGNSTLEQLNICLEEEIAVL
jgi:sugar/nucleoside kinase (ribokinase family)